MKIKKPKFVVLQLACLALVAPILFFVSGWFGVRSFLLGASSWIIPSQYFGWQLHRISTIFDHQRILRSFFLSEAIKLGLSFSMITLILLIAEIRRLEFLIGYVAMIASSLFITLAYEIKR